MVDNRFSRISGRFSGTDVQCVGALGSAFTFTRAILPVDAIWARCLTSLLKYRPYVLWLQVPFAQVCSARCVCARGVYYLGFVSHGSFAQHRDLGSGLFLQTLDCIALRTQNLPHEIELTAKQNRTKLA